MANLFGTGVNQVPTNGMLGNMAFQDKAYLSADKIGIGTTAVDTGTANQTLQNYGGAYISGNVGVGTTRPQQVLDVVGNQKIFGKTIIGNSINSPNILNNLDVNSSTGITAFRSINLIDSSAAIKVSRTGGVGSGALVELQHWDVGLSTNYGYWDFVSEDGYFGIRDRKKTRTRIFIDDNGSVLVGTNAQTLATNYTQLVGIGTDKILSVDGNTYTSGTVGIGTTNSGAKLHVVPTSTGISGLFSGSTSGDMIRITQGGTGNALVVEDSANPDSTPLIVTGIGSVGIGTVTPTQPLDVNGNVRLRSGLYDFNNNVGAAGSVLTSTGSSIFWAPALGMSVIDSQIYTSVGTTTWTKPSGAKIISFAVVAGGGGGCGGAASQSTGATGGTGGGAGGGVIVYTIGADFLNSTETVIVGSGGTGGIGTSRNLGTAGVNAGNIGTAGGNSRFGLFIAVGGGGGSYTSANNAVAFGGNPDVWTSPTVTRNNTTGVTVTEPTAIIPYFGVSGAGGSGAATDKDPAAVAASNTTDPAPAGGGFGGTPGSLTATENGGAGASAGTSVGIVTGGSGGTSGSINGANGNNQLTPYGVYAAGGGGGFGAYVASGTATGGNGGNGGFPGGGGGGGGSARNNTATVGNIAIGGSGGTGGSGMVIVITYG